MSPTTSRVYAFIAGFIIERGYGPTHREIVDGLGLSSTSVAAHHLSVLRRRGLVTYVDGQARTLRIVGPLEGVR